MDSINFKVLLESIAGLLNVAGDIASSDKSIMTGATSRSMKRTPINECSVSDLFYDMASTIIWEAENIFID